MTEEEAISAARQLVEAESIDVVGLDSVGQITPDMFPDGVGVRNPFWVVRFLRPIPEDCVCTSELLLVEVDDITAKAEIVLSL
jgi:hypothetical protein